MKAETKLRKEEKGMTSQLNSIMVNLLLKFVFKIKGNFEPSGKK